MVSISDTELQNVIFSYPEKAVSLEGKKKKSVIVQCLSGLISSVNALEEARATSHVTVLGEKMPLIILIAEMALFITNILFGSEENLKHRKT